MELSTLTFKPQENMDLKTLVTTIPDFPKPGIQFKDINPILANPEAFNQLIDLMSVAVRESGANKIVGLESRGFIFGIAIAQNLGLPFVPARKAGKLPGATVKVDYSLEYGSQSLELQRGSITGADCVAIVDDLLATGGTAKAAEKLIKELGGSVSGFFFAIELEDLAGRQQFVDQKVSAILCF
jgi:adenine phosphoribosyltransferase